MKALYKIGLLILISAIAAEKEPLGPDIVKKARKLQTYCQKQTNISDELILQSRQNIFPNDREMQCFLQCNLDIGGMMSSNNTITLEPLTMILPESYHEMIKRIQGICGTQAGADACEIAYNTFLCYAANTKNPMIL